MPSAQIIGIDERGDAQRAGEYVLLQLALPAKPVHNIGVLLLDTESDCSRLRLRARWDDLADAEDAAYLAELDRDFHGKIEEMGARGFLESIEDSFSHVLRVSERKTIAVDSFTRVADRIFARHVEPLPVARYRTHLPLYTLRAAAGKFGADEEVEAEDWVRVPEGMRLNEGMFVAHVVGQSMLPRIPEGSLNIFRAPVVGSRQGKIVLVELIGVHEKYTVKRYTSKKIETGEDEWEHASIRLEPLNPAFEPLDLRPDQLTVVAEWICTLE